MWYFYLSPAGAAKLVAYLAGRARFFSWRNGCLAVLPEKGEAENLSLALASLGIFPQKPS